MNQIHESLPSFLRPPVIEVVLSVQFEPIAGFGIQHFGLLWESIKDNFPIVQSHPPLQPVFEQFDRPERQQGIQFQFGGPPLLPRMWLLNVSGTELLQLQNDRFVHNWRKSDDDEPYPRYERLRNTFARDYENFCRVLEGFGLGTPRVNQCEVSYINHIRADHVWSRHSEISSITNLVSSQIEFPANLSLEGVNVAARCLIHAPETAEDHSRTRVIGRLHVEITPAFSAPNISPIFVMNLTARGEPLGNEVNGVLEFFDLGRRAIVESFESITTDHMHQIWGIENVR